MSRDHVVHRHPGVMPAVTHHLLRGHRRHEPHDQHEVPGVPVDLLSWRVRDHLMCSRRDHDLSVVTRLTMIRMSGRCGSARGSQMCSGTDWPAQ